MSKTSGIYDYARLDASGEAERAAARMEARAREPASTAMFESLVAPLLSASTRRILEVGAGTGALARRLAAATAATRIVATDKSAAMVRAARALSLGTPGAERCEYATWDARDDAPECATGPFELILSSVMVPYLDDEETALVCRALASRLAPGGVLAFVEQDLQTNALHHSAHGEVRALFRASPRAFLPLSLRGALRDAGLLVLPRRSFLWTSETYGPYLRDLVGHAADEAVRAGRIDLARAAALQAELEAKSDAGEFYYGLVYHRIAAQAPE